MKYLFNFFLETLLLLFDLLSSILEFVLPKKILFDNSKQNIIIIPGFFTGDIFFFRIRRFFKSHNFHVIIDNNNLHFHDVRDRAQKLKELIEKNNIHQPIVIGISAGSLVAYDYYAHYDGKGRIKKMFFIGAPFQGTPLAYLVSFTKTGRSMIPNSNYLRYILSGPSESESSLISINAKYDEVVPNAGLKYGKIETVNIFGHAYLCAFNKEVYNLILKNIKTPG